MQVHKVMELIKGLADENKLDNKLSEFFINKLVKSEKFVFDFGEFPNECKNEIEFSELVKCTKLPFELCYFEIPNFGAILAYKPNFEKRYVKLQFFYYNSTGKWSMLNPEDKLAIDLNYGTLQTLSEDLNIKRLYKTLNKENELTVTIMNLVVRALSVLNCSNVVTVENEPPKALNKKRLRNGKFPIFSFKTLSIKIPVCNKRKACSEGNRTSPRLHLRRGHVRKYENYSLWINDMVVGDISKGAVFKNYNISN